MVLIIMQYMKALPEWNIDVYLLSMNTQEMSSSFVYTLKTVSYLYIREKF